MQAIVAVVSCALLFVVLWDAFEGIVLPRRVTRRLRLTRLFYRYTWLPWSAAGRRMRPGKRRERYLSYYGPLSMLLLLSVWAASLIVGFAMLQWAFGSAMNAPEGAATFGTDLYVRGTTFFTLGLGDVVPRTPLARALTVVEAGTGFGVLALVIGYLPVLYQAFSQREVSISLLDARAGSPPSATELLRRHSQGHMEELRQLLRDWERWAAEVLESHLSYPVLGYYRSQHDNQSWLAALTTILDASALVIVGIDAGPARQALLTFAMARHAVVDLAQIFNTPPGFPGIAGVVIGANCILVLYNAIRWVSLPHLFFALGRGKRGTFANRIFWVTENRGVGSRRAITCSRLETDREWRER
ncbi:MAG: two pore domain potassium channel family protein [Nitrospinae bacterium]|nr:two pore domain potassium channel family protein [Nitrospinota bacterium]